ncbi:MAG: LysE family transporter [Candidatus Magasanikiibacteriota bacterium]
MPDFLKFIILGISFVAAIGPVTILTIRRGLEHGFWSAFITNMGAVLIDAIYLILIFFAFTSFFQSQTFSLVLGTFGVLLLIYFGIGDIKNAFGKNILDKKIKKTFGDTFWAGFLINITNPLAPIAWLGFYSIFASNPNYNTHNLNFLINLGFVILGAIIWGFVISFLAHMGKRFVNEKVMKIISFIAGCILIAFAIYLGYSTLNNLL